MRSQRHHFIPEFFIKAFSNADQELYLYNKKLGKIDKNSKSAKQIFFAWNRNTFIINGQKTDFLEQVYNFSESKFAIIHKRLIEKFEPVNITKYDILHLTLFIAEIYWRIPSQDNEAFKLFKKIDNNQLPFKIKNKITGEIIPTNEIQEITSHPGFIASMRKIKSIEEYLQNAKNIKTEDWRIFYSPEEAPQCKILSDNPVIIRNQKKKLLESELIFPLSKGKTIYHSKGKQLNKVPALNKVLIDILLFLQGERYVVSADKDYLASISELAKSYNTSEKINILKEKIFQVFD